MNETLNATLNSTINATMETVAPYVAPVVEHRIIYFMPDWVLFIIIGIVALFIYHYLPADIKNPIKTFIVSYGFYILLALLWLYFRSKWGFIYQHPEDFPSTMRKATFWALFVLLLVQAGKWLLAEQRYLSSAFVSDMVQGSAVRIQTKGDYAVAFIGTAGSSTEKIVLPWFFPNKLVICPSQLLQQFNDKTVCYAHLEKVDLEDLPEMVRNFIESDPFARFAKNEIYYGEVSIEAIINNPEMKEIIEKYKKVNNRNAELDGMLKGKLSTTKRFISDTFAMQDKIRGKDWLNRNPQPVQMEE